MKTNSSDFNDILTLMDCLKSHVSYKAFKYIFFLVIKYFDLHSDVLRRSDHLILAEIEGNRSGFINLLVLWIKNSVGSSVLTI